MKRTVRYRYRLVAGLLLVTLPIMSGLALLLTARSSSSLTSASHEKVESLADAIALRVDDWLAERQNSLVVLAGQAERIGADDASIGDVLAGAGDAYDDFEVIQIVEASGSVVASSTDAVGD